MNYTILTCEQRSPEWFQARLGRLTASVAGKMLAAIKSGEAADRRNLRVKLVLERVTGKMQENGFTTQAMQNGIDREPLARRAYQALVGELVENTGFVQSTEHMAGCSLDGCVFDRSGRIVKILELKSPEPAAHLSYLRTGVMGASYEAQVIHSLWITGAQSCDWMSYQPEFPEHLQAKLITIPRVEAVINDYAQKALAFLAEVDREVAELQAMRVA